VLACNGEEDIIPEDTVNIKRVNNDSAKNCRVMLHNHTILPQTGDFLNILPYLVVVNLILPFHGICDEMIC
jgi:hypothetical protein